MKIQFDHFAHIRTGEIDLSTPLVLFTGRNNSGKSYAAYATYGLFKLFDSLDISGISTFLKQEIKKGVPPLNKQSGNIITLDLEGLVLGLYNGFEKALNDAYLKSLPTLFNSRKFVTGVRINHPLNSPTIALKEFSEVEFDFSFTVEAKSIFFRKKIGEAKIEIVLPSDTDEVNSNSALDNFLFTLFFENLKAQFPQVFFFPAERNALNQFSSSILTNRARANNPKMVTGIVQALMETDESVTYRRPLPLPPHGYALPIQDYLNWVNDFAGKNQEEGAYSELASEIEKLMLDGKVKLDDYGHVSFLAVAPKSKKENVDLSLGSSLIKSLSSLVIYLRYFAQEGDFIIIDEPELNLHPDKQRAFAWVIGLLLNKGFKMMVSTHSDYLIREINCLVMLGAAEPKAAKKLAKKLGYAPEIFIRPDQISAYLFDKGEITEIPVTHTGLETKTIDETTANQNLVLDEVYYTLVNASK